MRPEGRRTEFYIALRGLITSPRMRGQIDLVTAGRLKPDVDPHVMYDPTLMHEFSPLNVHTSHANGMNHDARS
jgi:hypothetical protein